MIGWLASWLGIVWFFFSINFKQIQRMRCFYLIFSCFCFLYFVSNELRLYPLNTSVCFTVHFKSTFSNDVCNGNDVLCNFFGCVALSFLVGFWILLSCEQNFFIVFLSVQALSKKCSFFSLINNKILTFSSHRFALVQ